MTKTLYDPTVEQKGMEKGMEKTLVAVKMLMSSESEEKIKDKTGFTLDQINKIKETFKTQENN